MGQFTFSGVADWVEKQIVHRVEQIRIVDFVDIVFLAILIGLAIYFISKSKAITLALGLALIMLASGLVTLFDMKGLMFIFGTLTQVGLIALVVVFQPELRHILGTLGRIPFSNIKHISSNVKNYEHIEKSVTILSETASDLSMKKTGALIVIERDITLGNHIKTGTIIDAQLSGELIKNLFYDKSPLHDGAVILRNYRVHAAGCVLPLSLKEDLDKSLGTRHRAAIGISEVSDAIVIVVSEETGRISIAHNGTLVQNYSYNSLKKELTKLLMPNDATKGRKRTKIKKDRKIITKEDNV